MSAERVLLLGAAAAALSPRLEVSGYVPLLEADTGPAADPLPGAAVLAAGEQGRIGALRQRFGTMPILLDIGEDTVEARVHCLSSGADDFWLSSLGASDLLMRLRLHLGIGQRARVPAQLLQVADLVVNPTAHQVKRGSRPVALTAREYQLLLLLLERQGTVVSREQILSQVWNDQRGAASNVIEVYVRYLRQKLEEGGERRLLHTVRGHGYCLSERLPLSPPPPPP